MPDEHAVGIHLFVIESAPQSDSRKPFSALEQQFILSISDGATGSQYGPVITTEEWEIIHDMLQNTDVIKRGYIYQLTWFLVTILGSSPFCFRQSHAQPAPLQTLDGHDHVDFAIHKMYPDTAANRERSMDIAQHHAMGRSSTEPGISLAICDFNFTLNMDIMSHYIYMLPRFRLKWLEIQNETKVIEDYQLQLIRQGTDHVHADDDGADESDLDPVLQLDLDTDDYTRFKMTIVHWSDHIRDGTLLQVELSNGRHVQACITRIHKRFVWFDIEGQYTSEDVKTLMIIHGGEIQYNIREHLSFGRKVFQDPNLISRHPFIAPLFDLPCASPDEARFNTLVKAIAFDNLEITPRRHTDTKDEPKSEHALQMEHSRKRRRLEHWASSIPRLIRAINNACNGDQFCQLNTVQRECALSLANMTICQGYPGTGKTQTEAGYVLYHMLHLLTQPSGWIGIFTSSNASAVSALRHLLKYPALKPLIVHAFSKTFHAFHEDLFRESYEFRLTKKKNLRPHGILICTIGSLRSVTRRYPHLGPRLSHIVIDEAGQVWKYDAILIHTHFPNVQRCLYAGDTNQLPPYVTKLASSNMYVESVMTPYLTTNPEHLTLFNAQLNIQYRMSKLLCDAHAKLFYDYKIHTFRQQSDNPTHDGLFFVRLPKTGEIGQVHSSTAFLDYAIKTTISVYRILQNRELKRPNGQPYTYAILCPYIIHRDSLIAAFKKEGICDTNLTISTIDARQGSEYDGVILTMGNTTCSALTRQRPRGNVAISRARNISVLLASDKFVASTRKSGDPQQLDHFPAPDTMERCLRYWGEWMLSPNNKPFNSNDVKSQMTLTSLRSFQARLLDSTDNDGTNNNALTTRVALARTTIGRPHISTIERQLIAKTLFLKRNYWTITPFHMKLFGAACACDILTFYEALGIYVDTASSTPRVRNECLTKLFNIDYGDKTVDPDLKLKIYNMYPVHTKPAKSRDSNASTKRRKR